MKNWRRALDVDRVSNPGTNRLIRRSAQAGAEVAKAHVFTDDEREVRRWNAKRLNLGRHLITGYHGPRWTAAELDLLATLPDAEAATRVGRSREAVRAMRARVHQR